MWGFRMGGSHPLAGAWADIGAGCPVPSMEPLKLLATLTQGEGIAAIWLPTPLSTKD